jgi:hypothetical protein
LLLQQFGMEARVEMLGASASGLLMGYKVNFKKVAKNLREHERKNKVNAFFLETSAVERAAQAGLRMQWRLST